MSGLRDIGRAPAPAPAGQRAQVRKLAHQLEGVFLDQLFKAMRESVPKDGLTGSAPGQEMFTQMFDEKMAMEAAARSGSHGIGDALYRQLAARLPAEGATETAK